ncbi:MAG: hypothetical protein JNG90_18675 [Planctomycetaceae bacterium]|nr:hypothetical protein [Planctomycetaceae bacterium]
MRPGQGTAVRPGAGETDTAANAFGIRQGSGTARPGIAGTGEVRNGTYHRPAAAEAAQGDAIRNGDYRNYSNPDAWGRYAYAWRPAGAWTGSYYANPGWGALAAGMGLAARATPYNYGSNVVVQPSTVYVNGDPAGTPQEYADQASQIAAAGQAAEPADDAKWMPLGVFAMVQGDATSSDDIFQLAVDEKGTIRGNYHNVKSDDVEPVSGSVDRETQRVAWTIGSDQFPIYETGISNLTKSQTPVLVHLDGGETNQVSLVRLEEPAQSQ